MRQYMSMYDRLWVG